MTGLKLATRDVTGTHSFTVEDLDPGLPAGALARSLVSEMQLPADVPWALRSDTTSVFLDDDVAIGDQVEPDDSLTVTPRSHLA